VNQVEEGFLFGESEPAPHSRREVFSLKVASEERCLPSGNPTVHQAEEVIFKDQGIDLLGSRVNHGGRLRFVEIRLPPVDLMAEVLNEILDLALSVMEREGEVFEALPPNEVGTDAVEHHGGTEALLGRLVRFSDPLEGSAEDLADSFNAIVPILREGFDVFNRVLRVGVADVVFGFSGCIHPSHLE
jgi:hypothetical protein